jgi:hypothetical protein
MEREKGVLCGGEKRGSSVKQIGGKMRQKITVKFLEKIGASEDVVEYAKETGIESMGVVETIKHLIKEDKLDWANWLIVRTMKYKQYVSYAVYAAEQVIDIYEKKYPDDDRPRKAIKAATRYVKNPSKKNKDAAWVAGDAASAAAWAAGAAAWAVGAAKKEMQIKILKYGIGLLRSQNEKQDG